MHNPVLHLLTDQRRCRTQIFSSFPGRKVRSGVTPYTYLCRRSAALFLEAADGGLHGRFAQPHHQLAAMHYFSTPFLSPVPPPPRLLYVLRACKATTFSEIKVVVGLRRASGRAAQRGTAWRPTGFAGFTGAQRYTRADQQCPPRAPGVRRPGQQVSRRRSGTLLQRTVLKVPPWRQNAPCEAAPRSGPREPGPATVLTTPGMPC